MEDIKISILVPTRKRNKDVAELINTGISKSNNPKCIEFIFYIDDDDTGSEIFIKKLSEYFNIKIIKGERIVLSEMWNECYKVATGDILMHCGDDIRFRTSGWDDVVINKFKEYPDNIVFLFGDDGVHRKGSFGTHGFIHRDWVETVGYFVPPYFSSDKNDTWLNEVARGINRWIYIDIYTEHMHPIVGKHTVDETHSDRLKRHKRDNIQELYNSKSKERLLDMDKLQKHINKFIEKGK